MLLNQLSSFGTLVPLVIMTLSCIINLFTILDLCMLKVGGILHLLVRKGSVLNILLIWLCPLVNSTDNWGLVWIRWNVLETFRVARGADELSIALPGRSDCSETLWQLPLLWDPTSGLNSSTPAHSSSTVDCFYRILTKYQAFYKYFVCRCCHLKTVIPGDRHTIFLFCKLGY